MDERLSTTLDAAFPERALASVVDASPSWNDENRTVRVGFAAWVDSEMSRRLDAIR